MGYSTDFFGVIEIKPPLSGMEVLLLSKFSEDRHEEDGTPGYYCQWIPSPEGTELEWDGGEKFYEADKWMKFLIDHFIGSDPLDKAKHPFLQGHVCNGSIECHGDELGDHWFIEVSDNVVETVRGEVVAQENTRQEVKL